MTKILEIFKLDDLYYRILKTYKKNLCMYKYLFEINIFLISL